MFNQWEQMNKNLSQWGRGEILRDDIWFNQILENLCIKSQLCLDVLDKGAKYVKISLLFITFFKNRDIFIKVFQRSCSFHHHNEFTHFVILKLLKRALCHFTDILHISFSKIG